MERITTKKTPAAIGPYSLRRTGRGSCCFPPARRRWARKPARWRAAPWRNRPALLRERVGAILEGAGFGFENAGKTTCFLADIADFTAFNAVYGEDFTGKPARSCAAVRKLPRKLLCESEVIAEY